MRFLILNQCRATSLWWWHLDIKIERISCIFSLLVAHQLSDTALNELLVKFESKDLGDVHKLRDKNIFNPLPSPSISERS